MDAVAWGVLVVSVLGDDRPAVRGYGLILLDCFGGVSTLYSVGYVASFDL